MITSKQRAFLRSMANGMTVILTVGKNGVTGEVTTGAEEALAARELIKGKVLENAPVTAREAAVEIAEAVNAEVVQVIGSCFVLYKENKKDKKIILPK